MTNNKLRKLDALVAEKVMGWVEYEGRMWGDLEGNFREYVANFHPTTDIAAAWEVVEKLQMQVEIMYWPHHMVDVYIKNYNKCDACDRPHSDVHVEADSLPKALCLAALKATGHDTGETE